MYNIIYIFQHGSKDIVIVKNGNIVKEFQNTTSIYYEDSGAISYFTVSRKEEMANIPISWGV